MGMLNWVRDTNAVFSSLVPCTCYLLVGGVNKRNERLQIAFKNIDINISIVLLFGQLHIVKTHLGIFSIT